MGDNDDDCSSPIHKFVAKQRELLDLELQAENDESSGNGNNSNSTISKDDSQRRRSHILGRLEASDISAGLYGRTVVQLTTWSSPSSEATKGETNDGLPQAASNGLLLLPAHRFAVGNEVQIRTKGGKIDGTSKKDTIGGVVSAVSDTSISVAIFQDRKQPSSISSAQTSNGKGKGKHKNHNSRSNKNKKSSGKDDDDDGDFETNLLNCAPLTLVPKSSIEVHKKLVAALERLQRHGEDHPIAGSVIQSMFSAPDSDGSERVPVNLQSNKEQNANQKPSFNPRLDSSQRDAIAFALKPERKFALIHGPPGTGKTTTVAELIRQAVHHHGMRVLVTAPSNVAVDNILERLTEAESLHQPTTTQGYKQRQKRSVLRTVRLGHPARIKPSIVKYSLEALVQSSDGTEIVRDVRKELESYLKVMSRSNMAKGSKSSKPGSKGQQQRQAKFDRRAAYKEIKALRKEVRIREEKVVQELIQSAHVVLATTVGADNRVLNQITHPRDGNNKSGDQMGFDLVIIDEAAQALEASCWIPILRGRKVVLAGDHCQLPPTIKSKDHRVVAGLGVTLFERLMNLYHTQEQAISRMLQIQYRMHHDIADWASQAMYHGELSTHESVRSRTLGQLHSVRKLTEKNQRIGTENNGNEKDDDLDHLSDTTLLLIDTAGCDMHEQETEAGSRFNEGEAMLVSQHVRKLLDLGVEQNQVAIITPYNGQVELLRNMLLPEFPRLEIRSVDGFQGGEREAVVLSLVRSSERGGRDGIGFLRDDRRQNVAVTRAKRHLTLICDSDTVSQSSFIHNLIKWVEDHGIQRSAIEYVPNDTNSTNKNEYEEDIRVAESELTKLIEESSRTTNKASSSKLLIKRVSKDNQKDLSSAQQHTKMLDKNQKNVLMDRIAKFIGTGREGEEMMLSSHLSSKDRRSIHEFSEKEGLGHRSEGTDGIDRKIILVIQKKSVSNNITRKSEEKTKTTNSSLGKETQKGKNDTDTGSKVDSKFSALSMHDSDSDEGETSESPPAIPDEEQKAEEESSTSCLPTGNSLLKQIAKERASRQQQKQQQSQPNNVSNANSKKKKKSKSKGHRLGGSHPSTKKLPKEDINVEELDDMAFLDAQIEKTQNAHGRNVVGTGKMYRTVVNGILNSRPEPKSKPINRKASAALRSKLSEAGNGRKKKTKK